MNIRAKSLFTGPLIDIRDLHVETATKGGSTQILKGVDLTLRSGEIMGLIGESGAGKSTLGLACMGYFREGLKVTSGSVKFDGVEVTNLPESMLRENWGTRVAYVAQSAAAAFNPGWRLMRQMVETAVDQHVMTRFDAQAKAVELFRLMGLPDPDRFGERFPHQVSGGQLQRAMVAMAMICKPDLLIFDEPTTALDVTTQIEVLSAIRDVVRKFGTAAVYVSHDLAVVSQMADRITVMRHGEVVESGLTRAIMFEPQQPYTRELLNAHKIQTPKVRRETPQHVLDVEGVSATYGVFQVLTDVSFTLKRGHTLAIVGESGSGKSTMARVITGLKKPSSGRIVFEGEELPGRYEERTRDCLRSIQLISQTPDTSLNPTQTVDDILSRPLKLYFGMTGETRRERVRELLTMIELDPDKFLTRKPSQLSGGQKQRLCIARALAARPSIIVCDEVTSALDRLVAKEILGLLARLQAELSLSIVFITHDLEIVETLSQDIIVMKSGRVVESGETDRVFVPPHDPYTELLLSSVPQMDPEWLNKVLLERRAGDKARATEAGSDA